MAHLIDLSIKKWVGAESVKVFYELTKVCYVERCSEEVSGTSFSSLGFGKTFFQLFCKILKRNHSDSQFPLLFPHEGKERSSSGRHQVTERWPWRAPASRSEELTKCRHRGFRAELLWSAALQCILKKWSLKVWLTINGEKLPSFILI